MGGGGCTESNGHVMILDERLTANCVTHLYPRTRTILDAMGVHAQFEGSDCLDEIAWRRGLSATSLVRTLLAAASHPQAGR